MRSEGRVKKENLTDEKREKKWERPFDLERRKIIDDTKIAMNFLLSKSDDYRFNRVID
jgi:hypothetical protein